MASLFPITNDATGVVLVVAADSRVTREVYTYVTARMPDGAAEAIERAAKACTTRFRSKWVLSWVPTTLGRAMAMRPRRAKAR